MVPVLKLQAPAKGLPKAKPGKARKTPPAGRKIWSGVRKKIAVSSLQLSLPGLGGVL